jgi:hypothetical protein
MQETVYATFISPFEPGCVIEIYKQSNGKFIIKQGHNHNSVFTSTLIHTELEISKYIISLYPNLLNKEMIEHILAN